MYKFDYILWRQKERTQPCTAVFYGRLTFIVTLSSTLLQKPRQGRHLILTEYFADDDRLKRRGAELNELIVLVEVTDALSQAVVGQDQKDFIQCS